MDSATTASSAETTVLSPPLASPDMKVNGGVYVVTGGTQGLGLAIAKLLKERGAAGLVLVSRNEEKGEQVCKEFSSSSCHCVFVKADLGSANDASNVITQAVEKMQHIGPINGVVNAAATTGRGNLFTTTADEFDYQFALNTRAPFLITQSVAKHMIEKNVMNGSIVNICSTAAYGGAPFIMAYSAAKAALVTITKNNAAELAKHKIRVNAINMGWTYTDNENKLQTEQSGSSDWIKNADNNIPLGRILRPHDVAVTVLYLLSNASCMMSGSIIALHPEYAEGMLSLLDTDSRM